jgi:hypothetical protein
MRALFPPGFVASWFAVVIATHAYGQESGLQEAIRHHLPKQAPVVEAPRTVMADLDGNGNAEAVVSYCINENPRGKNARASNPAKVHCTVTVFIQKDARWIGAGQVKLGLGKVRDVRGGVIYAESVNFGPNDPLCCPSRKVSRRLGLKNGKLIQLR